MRPDCPALPPVIGHRGAADSAPENTLAGFRRARELGCRWVEFDVRLTADGVPVICHDDKLDRTTGRPGRISTLPFAALRDIDAGAPFDIAFAGERIPTLDDTLTVALDLGLGANIEIKAESGRARATAAAVAACLARRRDDLPPLLISSFLTDALAVMRDLAPAYPRGLLLRQVAPDWRETAAALDCATLHVDCKRLRPGLAAAIRSQGYPLLAYTVNDAANAQRLFDWGVTSVFSDVPDKILSMITRNKPRSRRSAFGPAPTPPRPGAAP